MRNFWIAVASMAVWMGVAQAQEVAQPQPSIAPVPGETAEAHADFFDWTAERARNLAAEPYQPTDESQFPQVLKDLDYSRYRDIRFNKEQALWRDQALFSVEFFHLGFLYREPVQINEITASGVRQIPYRADQFHYGEVSGISEQVDSGVGFAGFRVHFPLNDADYEDELLVFLGASYFRLVARGQLYGLSARGLAVNTATPGGEEFPRFTEFWLERPAPDSTRLVIHALLDSPSVSGAYRFELNPGKDSVIEVRSRLFAREDVEKLGVAPLTSMFFYGSDRVRHVDDFRPRVHDSDGLLTRTRSGEWIWRPLANPPGLRVSSLLDENPTGFGLLQREREFQSYQDAEARYDRRPSFWITPRGAWGRGAVELVEIPTSDETNDNIVAFWRPETPFRAGEERAFDYEIRATGSQVSPSWLARVHQTRTGWGATPGAAEQPSRELRQFKVDFRGGDLDGLDANQPVQPELSATAGEISDVRVQKLPDEQGWRVSFKLMPEPDKPSDMRLNLTLHGERISETWNYVWTTDALEPS